MNKWTTTTNEEEKTDGSTATITKEDDPTALENDSAATEISTGNPERCTKRLALPATRNAKSPSSRQKEGPCTAVIASHNSDPQDTDDEERKMVHYRMVRHCGLCKKRYVIEKGDPKTYYCAECQERINKAPKDD